MVLGSEGRLGVITEATIHVRRMPPERKILGYLFPTWPAGLGAMRDIAASDASPSVTRVSDAPETAFRSPCATPPRRSTASKSKGLQTFLKRRGWDLEAMCLSFIGYEGSADYVARQRKLTERIVKRHGGLCIGASPGSCTTRRSSTRRTSATSCSTAGPPPTSRRPRRRGAGCRALRQRHGGRPRRLPPAGRARLPDVPPVALLPRGSLPLLHVRPQPAGRPRRPGGLRRGEAGDPAGVRGLGRHAVPPPRGGHRARPVAGGGHLGAGRGDAACAVRGHRPGANLNPGKIVAVDPSHAEPAELDIAWTRRAQVQPRA